MPFIGTQPDVGGYSVLDALTASATASYTLQKDSANFVPASANQLLVSLNGVIQKPGSSFTVSGSTLTFSSALTSSDSIDFIISMGEPLLVGTPSDGTVTGSKLASNIGISTTGNIATTGDLTVDTSTLKVDSSNNRVGIGTVTPSVNLHIVEDATEGTPTYAGATHFAVQASASSGDNCNMAITSGSAGTSRIMFGDKDDEDIGKIEYDNSNNDLTFFTDTTERFRISSDGAIKARANGVGEIGGTMHHFSNSAANTYTLMARNHSSSPASHYIMELQFQGASPDNSSAKFLQCRDSSGARLNINSDGDVQNHDNSYGSTSDLKLKEQISDASEQWDDVKALKVRKFKYKTDVATGDSDEHWRLGVIAQELEAAGMNKLVREESDIEVDAEGKITETGEKTKIVKYSILYMKAVKALQEAMTRIETLETKVKALESE